MNKIITAPETYKLNNDEIVIFLAGSIELGVAEDWQTRAENTLHDPEAGKVVTLNPRRSAWDATWSQSLSNPDFAGQVEWEHQGLEDSDIIMMYFDPDTKSPITLLELGLFADSGKAVVCCPKGFWRRGNVEYICQKYDIPLFETFDDTIECIKGRIWRLSLKP